MKKESLLDTAGKCKQMLLSNLAAVSEDDPEALGRTPMIAMTLLKLLRNDRKCWRAGELEDLLESSVLPIENELNPQRSSTTSQ